MKTKLLISIAALALVGASAQAAVTVTRSSTAPTTDADDQYYLPGPVNEGTEAMNADGNGNANSGENDALTYIENGRPAKGMWFTTGSNPSGYTISSVTIRTMLMSSLLSNGSFANVANGSTFDFRFGTYNTGTSTLTPLFSTTSATFGGATINYSGTAGIGEYLTFNVSGEGLAVLSPNATYFFEVSHNGGYMELHNTKADGYAGGSAFIGNDNGTFDVDGVVAAPTGGGDYAFHVNLTAVGAPLSASSTGFSPSATVYRGTTVTASTVASGGTAPYTYQWQVDTGSGYGDISGGTSSTYNIDTLNQGGTTYGYRVIVTDSASAMVTNSPAVLTVQNGVFIVDAGTSDPTVGGVDISQLSTAGDYNFFSPINYYVDANPPPGQTFTTGSNPGGYSLNEVFVKQSTQGGNAGGQSSYTLRLYSINGTTATFVSAYTNDNVTPSFSPSIARWVRVGGSITNTLLPNKTYAYTFQRNGGGYWNLAVTTSNPYSGGQVCSIPAGGGTVNASVPNNDAAFVVKLSVITIPLTILSNPVPVTVDADGSGSFSVYAHTDNGTITGYQWYAGTPGSGTAVANGANINGTVFSGATSSMLSFTSAAVADSGTTYYCEVTSDESGGTTASSTAAGLTVNDNAPPSVTAEPTFTRPTVPVGESTEVSAAFTGTAPLFYQWQHSATNDGSGVTDITGATSSSYTIANAAPANIGYYRLVASNSFGVTPSGWAALQVSAGQLYSFEPFASYTTGTELPSDLPSQAVTGYTGYWTDVAFGDAEPSTSAGSLVYGGAGYAAGTGDQVGKGADAAGIAANNCGRVSRLLDGSLAAPHGTTRTVYLSWLFKTGNENAAANANTYQTLALWNGDAGTDGLRDFEAGIAAGDFGTANYGFRVDNASAANLGVSPNANVHLFVAKFVLNAASLSDSVTVWIDPALGSGEPTGGVTLSGKDIAFDRLALSDYASDSSAWDEVRWGDSFNAVTIFHAPTAADLDLGVTAGGSTTATVIGKFAPATDGDGDAVSVSAVTQGASGTVTFNGTTVTYANTAAAATDSFTYTVSDGKGGTAIRTVSVLISSPEGFNKLSGPTGTGPYSFSYLGIPGEDYALEETADLPATASSVWTTVATQTATSTGAVNFSGVTLSHPSGSFRTRHVP